MDSPTPTKKDLPVSRLAFRFLQRHVISDQFEGILLVFEIVSLRDSIPGPF